MSSPPANGSVELTFGSPTPSKAHRFPDPYQHFNLPPLQPPTHHRSTIESHNAVGVALEPSLTQEFDNLSERPPSSLQDHTYKPHHNDHQNISSRSFTQTRVRDTASITFPQPFHSQFSMPGEEMTTRYDSRFASSSRPKSQSTQAAEETNPKIGNTNSGFDFSTSSLERPCGASLIASVLKANQRSESQASKIVKDMKAKLNQMDLPFEKYIQLIKEENEAVADRVRRYREISADNSWHHRDDVPPRTKNSSPSKSLDEDVARFEEELASIAKGPGGSNSTLETKSPDFSGLRPLDSLHRSLSPTGVDEVPSAEIKSSSSSSSASPVIPRVEEEKDVFLMHHDEDSGGVALGKDVKSAYEEFWERKRRCENTEVENRLSSNIASFEPNPGSIRVALAEQIRERDARGEARRTALEALHEMMRARASKT